MRILIAGATGAIGRPVVRRLKEAGHVVFGLARAEKSAKMLSELRADVVARALHRGGNESCCRTRSQGSC
jgi:nucleoside-diphosphate-sugar epimerase